MPDYTKLNLKQDVENMAPKFGIEGLESRFARDALGLEVSGVSYFRVAPDFRIPFGHRHGEQEEVYVLLSGSARLAVDDEVIELAPFDAVRLPGPAVRCLEGGPEGAEMLAFGSPSHGNKDAEMIPGWWAGQSAT